MAVIGFFSGVSYLTVALILSYGLQRIPRMPVVDRPDWGRVEDVVIPAADGGWLEVWRVTPDRPNGLGIVLAHGWGRNRDRMVGRARVFARWGYTTIMHSSRDHGNSSALAAVSVMSFCEDIESVLDWIEEPVLLYGHSAGSGGAIIAAVRNPDRVRLLFLEAVYFDTRDALIHLYRWGNRLLGTLFGPAIVVVLNVFYKGFLDLLSPRRMAGHVAMPVMIVHGENDHRFPQRFARQLSGAFKSGQVSLFIAPGARHSTSFQVRGTPIRISRFLKNRGYPAEPREGI